MNKDFDAVSCRFSRMICFILSTFFLLFGRAFSQDIRLQGIMGDAALVNGEILQAGEQVNGVTVVSIQDEVVIFRDEQGKKFTRSMERSGIEKFAHGVNGFFRSMAQKWREWKSGLSADSILPSGRLAQKADKKETFKVGREASVLSLPEKVDLAESDFSEMKRDIDRAFADFSRTKQSESEARKVMNRVQKLMSEDVRRFNSLGLPCPMASRLDPNMSSYVQWSEGFMKRKNAFMNDVNARMNKLFQH